MHRYSATEMKGRLVFTVNGGKYVFVNSNGQMGCEPQDNRGAAVALAMADYRQEFAANAVKDAQIAKQDAVKAMTTPPKEAGCCDDEPDDPTDVM